MIKNYTRAAAVAAALTMAMATMPAWADVKDYEFQLVSKEVKKGDAVIAVKLVHKPSGRAIPDAVIFAKRIDMGPDNMADMQAKLDPVPGGEPGVYSSRPTSTWPDVGPSRSAPRCKAKRARCKPSSSSTQNDTAQSTTGNRRGPRGRGGSGLLGRAHCTSP